MVKINNEMIELDKYVLRNTARAGCLEEFYLFFQLFQKIKDIKEVRRMLMDNEILGHFTYYTRLTIWKLFSARYLSIKDKWVIEEFCDATKYSSDSTEFNSLLYLYFIVRDKFTFEFVTKILFTKYLKSSYSIDLIDIQKFYDNLSLENDAFTKLTNSSKKKLLSNTLTTLVDFRILDGKKIKTISKPSIPQRTIYHTYRMLKFQDLSFEQIVNSDLWKIYFWNSQDVRRNLLELFNKPEYKDLKDVNHA